MTAARGPSNPRIRGRRGAAPSNPPKKGTPMPKKTAARSPRGREKSAPKAPSIKAFRALEQRQGELIQLQRETLQQLAEALKRISILEAAGPRQKDERLLFTARAFRLEFQRPRPEDTDRLQRAIFSERGVRWMRRMNLIPTPPPLREG